MAHLDPTGAARDRAIEAMEQCWRDLSDRYDRPPLPPPVSLEDIEALNPDDQDDDATLYVKRGLKITYKVPAEQLTLF